MGIEGAVVVMEDSVVVDMLVGGRIEVMVQVKDKLKSEVGDLLSARAQSRPHMPGIASLAVGTACPAVVEGCTAAAEYESRTSAKLLAVFPTRRSGERIDSWVFIHVWFCMKQS